MPTKTHTARVAAERSPQATLPEVPAASPAADDATQGGNRPVARVNFGGVQASIWANHGEKGDFHTVTFSRRYQEGGEWKSSNSYSPNDLLALQKVSDMALDKVIELQQQQSRGRAA